MTPIDVWWAKAFASCCGVNLAGRDSGAACSEMVLDISWGYSRLGLCQQFSLRLPGQGVCCLLWGEPGRADSGSSFHRAQRVASLQGTEIACAVHDRGVLSAILVGGWSEVCALQCGVASIRGFQVRPPLFQNGTGGISRVRQWLICIDVLVTKAFAACCGVNLAVGFCVCDSFPKAGTLAHAVDSRAWSRCL